MMYKSYLIGKKRLSLFNSFNGDSRSSSQFPPITFGVKIPSYFLSTTIAEAFKLVLKQRMSIVQLSLYCILKTDHGGGDNLPEYVHPKFFRESKYSAVVKTNSFSSFSISMQLCSLLGWSLFLTAEKSKSK